MNVLDELLAELQPITLTDVKFFQPTGLFFHLMKPFRNGRLIYDIGAGVGHITQDLLDRNYRCLAIDYNRRDNPETCVIQANSVTYKYKPDSVLMFCRPCHSGFVAATIRQGLRCNVKDFIYVSKPQNRQIDLGSFVHKFSSCGRNVGHEHESMYIMTR
jgi:hypothetical protein